MRIAVFLLCCFTVFAAVQAEVPDAVSKSRIIGAAKQLRLARGLMSDIASAMVARQMATDGRANWSVPETHRDTFNQAGKYLRKSAELNPHFPATYLDLANWYADDGKVDVAIRQLGHAIRLDDEFERALVRRVVLCIQLNQFAKASEDLERLKKLDAGETGQLQSLLETSKRVREP